MKKIATLLIISILLSIATDAMAKKRRRRSFRSKQRIGTMLYGAKVTFGASNVYGKFNANAGKFKFGTELGMVGSYQFAQDAYLIISPSYAYYGSSVDNANPPAAITSENVNYRFHYISLPIQVRFDLSNFYAALGPQINFLVSAKGYHKYKGNFTYFENESVTESLNRFDVGGRISFGYKFEMGMFIELSYYNSFGDITKDTPSDNSLPISKNYNTNSYIGLGVGILLQR
jgi:hypothetical protein